MAGSSAITLHRSEDATILLQFQARQAAKTYVPDLSLGELHVQITRFPTDDLVLDIQPGQSVAGCTLNVSEPDMGRAILFLATPIWTGVPNDQCLVRSWLSTGSTRQLLGEQIILITE